MVAVIKNLTCDLCGMDITADPVMKEIDGQIRHFCCQGCARAYENATQKEMLSEIQPAGKMKASAHGSGASETAYFSMSGMWCAGCAIAAENVLKNQHGIKDANISFAAERGRLKYDPHVVDIDQTLGRLDKLGYHARLLGDAKEEEGERKQEKILLQLITALAFSMQVMFLYIERLYPLYNLGQTSTAEVRNIQYIVWILATPVLFIGGSTILRGAWRALLARTATMDTLVALGTLSAYSYSIYRTLTLSGETYFDSVAMITTFIMIGRYLETIGGNQARKDIRNLVSLQPQKAWLKSDGDWGEVKVNVLSLGDVVLVKPGERVPVDGEIIEGEAVINESMLTGESLPVDKSAGDHVYAGTLIADNAVQVRVTGLSQHTRLAEITRLVETTLSEKPPIQRMADKASKYFAIGILIIAALTGLGWLLFGAPLSSGVLHSVAVLVVACPCALGLATPLALTITLGKSSQKGILIRNPVALETAGQINRIIFDKTGTLTRGQLQVIDVEVNEGIGIADKELLCIAAAVEQFSEHPIAKTIVNACDQKLLAAHHFLVERGQGVSAHVGDNIDAVVKIGSEKFLGVDEGSSLKAKALDHSKKGETVIWIGLKGTIFGFIVLRDTLNDQSINAVHSLANLDVEPVVLSGDSPATTEAVSREIGIQSYQGNCLPEQKASLIKEWRHQQKIVAMVGDGVNDAPALAQSDLSITVMGGTDVAGETSDIVLMRDDLNLIPWIVNTSRRTRRVILENLGWAFAYNLVSVPLASFGLISPVIAAVAMATSSLLVVGNSLRLRN